MTFPDILGLAGFACLGGIFAVAITGKPLAAPSGIALTLLLIAVLYL